MAQAVSPGFIEAMIQVYYSPYETSTIMAHQAELLLAGVAEECHEPGRRKIKATVMGEVWVQMLTETPFPIQKWVDPRYEGEGK